MFGPTVHSQRQGFKHYRTRGKVSALRMSWILHYLRYVLSCQSCCNRYRCHLHLFLSVKGKPSLIADKSSLIEGEPTHPPLKLVIKALFSLNIEMTYFQTLMTLIHLLPPSFQPRSGEFASFGDEEQYHHLQNQIRSVRHLLSPPSSCPPIP